MEKEKEGFPITSLREINTLLKVSIIILVGQNTLLYRIYCFQAQHPNIVTVREIVVGSNMDKIFIVMDYVEHDLKSLMETMKHKKQVILYIYSILTSYNYNNVEFQISSFISYRFYLTSSIRMWCVSKYRQAVSCVRYREDREIESPRNEIRRLEFD